MTYDIYHSPDAADGISPQEAQLAQSIEQYRTSNGLPLIPISASLSLVAERHVEDIVYNLGGYNPGPAGSNAAHSWSDAPYDARDPNTYKSIWSAPQRLGTSYTGNGYEILTGYLAPDTATTTMDPATALASWESSPLHNALLLNQGSWSTPAFTWNAMGVAILDGVASVWFGHETDPASLGSIFSGTHDQYTVAMTGNGSLFIQDNVAGRDGTTTTPSLTYFRFADGVGRFDPTGNAEEVARLFKAAFNRVSDQPGLDYWTAKLDAHSLQLSDVAMSFIGSAEFSSKYGSLQPDQFVSQLYQNVLGRAGESSGVQYWTNQIKGGESTQQVLMQFSDGIENKLATSSTIGDKDLSEAYRLYQAAFNRTPDSSGLGYWTTRLDQGSTTLQVANEIAASPEFANNFAAQDATGLVGKLYQNVLHRSGDAGGIQYWTGQIGAGATRAQVLLGFSDSPENRLGTASATHDNWIFLGQ